MGVRRAQRLNRLEQGDACRRHGARGVAFTASQLPLSACVDSMELHTPKAAYPKPSNLLQLSSNKMSRGFRVAALSRTRQAQWKGSLPFKSQRNTGHDQLLINTVNGKLSSCPARHASCPASPAGRSSCRRPCPAFVPATEDWAGFGGPAGEVSEFRSGTTQREWKGPPGLSTSQPTHPPRFYNTTPTCPGLGSFL